jgi:hypothetical protein
MSSDSQNEKPEWMELAEGDSPAAEIRKTSKKLPAIAVLVTGAVIATGAFLANASETNNSQNDNPAGSFQPGTGGPRPDDGDGDRHHDGDHGQGMAPKIPAATSSPAASGSNA